METITKTSYSVDELHNLNLDYSHEQIIENLKNDDLEDFIKIFSIISLKNLEDIEEAHILFKHLTNHPTPIREIVALKLEEIYQECLFDDFIKEQFLKSIIDINPNVSRAICSIVSTCGLLKNELCFDLIERIDDLLVQIKDCDKELGSFYNDALKIRKNHAKNKKLFSLYWYLECLSLCNFEKYNSQVLKIIKETIKFNDYTIREKTAKILLKFEDIPSELLNLIKLDQNFYVKNQVYDKIKFED